MPPSTFNSSQTASHPQYYEDLAKEGWFIWRLIFEGGMSYGDVSGMDIEDLLEANAALDYYHQLLEESKNGGTV
jgi:hypothetical protein